MTDQALDDLAKRLLLDTAILGWNDEVNDQTEHAFSRHFEKRMKSVLIRADHPVRYYANRMLIALLLIVFLGGGFVLTFSVEARASFTTWVREIYESFILYRYTGESDAVMPEYEIKALPQGFRESSLSGNDKLDTQSGIAFRIYENLSGEKISFTYVSINDGALSWFSTSNADVTDVKVINFDGTFFQSIDPANMNTLTWVDTKRGVQFAIDGYFNCEEMMRMAESVDLVR